MTTGRRHLTRHQMKQDEFVSWMTQATMWVEENRRAVVAGIGGVALAAVLAIAGYTWLHSSRETAFARLGDVERVARAPLAGEPGAGTTAPADEKERASRVIEAADRMLRDYGSGEAADWVRYHRAAALMELGRTDDALKSLEPLMGSGAGTLLSDLAHVLAGRVEESRSNWVRAAEIYAAVASSASKGFPVEVAIFDQARCLGQAGKTQEAIAAYQKILDVYSDSPLASQANEKIQQLRGAAQGL